MNLLLRADREPALAAKLAVEQQRLTNALETQIQRMQVLGGCALTSMPEQRLF